MTAGDRVGFGIIALVFAIISIITIWSDVTP